MGDLVFSQLDDIANDTFDEFAPYTPPLYSHKSFDEDFHSINHNVSTNYFVNGMDISSSPTSFEAIGSHHIPSVMGNSSNGGSPFIAPGSTEHFNMAFHQQQQLNDIKIRDLHLHDHNGQKIDNRGITKTKLKLLTNFFGLEFEDSVRGKSVTQFFPSDIISIVRQCDKIGILIQFRKFLTPRVYGGDNSPQQHSGDTYFKDSPLARCMSLLLELLDHKDVSCIFDYVSRSDVLMTNLRVVYPQWMFCVHSCTSTDIRLFQLKVESSPVNQKITKSMTNVYKEKTLDDIDISDRLKQLTLETNSIPNENSSMQCKLKMTKPIKWAKNARKKNQEKLDARASRNNQNPEAMLYADYKSETSSVLDTKKIKYVLPLAFKNISKDLQDFIHMLLDENMLMPFQLTVGLCEILALAVSQTAKTRAMRVLYKLSQHKNAQLTNMHNVARFIVPVKSSEVANSNQVVC